MANSLADVDGVRPRGFRPLCIPFLLSFGAPSPPLIDAMKSHIADLVSRALEQLAADNVLDAADIRPPLIERARDANHGDFATNAAMVNSKAARMRPRELAEKLVAALPTSAAVVAVEIAGPGFINFRLAGNSLHALVPQILNQGHS